jgi:integrase
VKQPEKRAHARQKRDLSAMAQSERWTCTSYGTMLVNSGADIKTVQSLMRHSSLETAHGIRAQRCIVQISQTTAIRGYLLIQAALG